jgi:hypothetical protein
MSTEFNDVSVASPAPPPADSAGMSGSSPDAENLTSSPTAGGATAGTDAQSNVDEQLGSAEPAQDDPLTGVPSLEELSQNPNQPHAKSLVQLRTAYEALKPKFSELETKYQAWSPVADKYQPGQVAEALELHEKLFSPVIENDQVKLVDGIPQYTTKPFVDDLRAQNPHIFQELAADILETPYGNGTVLTQVLTQLGLDPNRLEDYRNLSVDASVMLTPDEQAEVTQKVPPALTEAFKSFSAEEQRDLLNADERARNAYLGDRQRVIANDKFVAETRANQERQSQQNIQTETETLVTKARTEGFDALKNTLAQWKLSADEKTNSVMQSVVLGSVAAILDPQLRFAVSPALELLGLKLDSTLDQAINTVEQKAREVATWKSQSNPQMAARAEGEYAMARMQVMAKLSPVVAKLMESLDGQRSEVRSAREQELSAALGAREIPTGSTSMNQLPVQLPAGMKPFSPEANAYVVSKFAS